MNAEWEKAAFEGLVRGAAESDSRRAHAELNRAREKARVLAEALQDIAFSAAEVKVKRHAEAALAEVGPT